MFNSINGFGGYNQVQRQNPDEYAKQYAEQNGLSLEDAKAELKSKYGDPQQQNQSSNIFSFGSLGAGGDVASHNIADIEAELADLESTLVNEESNNSFFNSVTNFFNNGFVQGKANSKITPEINNILDFQNENDLQLAQDFSVVQPNMDGQQMQQPQMPFSQNNMSGQQTQYPQMPFFPNIGGQQMPYPQMPFFPNMSGQQMPYPQMPFFPNISGQQYSQFGIPPQTNIENPVQEEPEPPTEPTAPEKQPPVAGKEEPEEPVKPTAPEKRPPVAGKEEPQEPTKPTRPQKPGYFAL